MRRGTLVAAAAWLAATAAPALAHGGNYPPFGPPPRAPTGTPGGGNPGGGGGPVTGGNGPLVTPDATETPSTIGADDWRRWWHANRSGATSSSSTPSPSPSAATTAASGDAAPGAVTEKDRERAVAALLAVVDDPNDDLASGALVALGRTCDPRAEAALLRCAADARRAAEVREAAVAGLAVFRGAGDAAAVRRFLESVAADRSSRPRLRAFAAYALGLRGERASAEMLSAIATASGEDVQVVGASLSALGMIGGDVARGVLITALAEPPRPEQAGETRVRRVFAAHGLARTGDAGTAAALRGGTRDEDPAVRRACILALGAVARSDDRESEKCLDATLRRDDDPGVRNFAALSLGRAGPPAARAALDEAWQRGRLCDRAFAALGLALLARRTGDGRVLDAPLADLPRRGAGGADAPGGRKEAAVAPELRGALAIAAGLASRRDVLPALRAIADRRDEDAWLRVHAVTAIGLLRDRDASPILRDLVDQVRAPSLQREAATALGLVADYEAVALLHRHLLSSPALFLRGASAVALGRIGGSTASRILVETLAEESRPGIVRAMAAVGIGRLLDRGRSLAPVAADLDPRSATDAVDEIQTIL